MRPASFRSEQWMTKYEHQAKTNLTDSSAESMTFEQLAKMEPDLLKDLVLDYGTIEGDLRLRKEILSFYKDRNPATLALMHGCSEANMMILQMLLSENDHVITFTPGYQQFSEIPRQMGCDVTLVSLNESDWTYDLDAFEKAIRPETRLVILNNPSNPTGAWLSGEQMERFISICRKHDLWVLNDEVYLYPDPSHPSMADQYEKAIVTSSISKVLGLPGLRLGWIKGPESVIRDVVLARDYSLISTGPVADRLALIALRHREAIRQPIQEIIDENIRKINGWLKKHPDFSWVSPANGHLGFLKYGGKLPSEELAAGLIEKSGILFVPGSCFDKDGYLRIGLGFRHPDLEERLDDLEAYLQKSMSKR